MGWTNQQAETITGVAFTYLASTVLFGAGSTLSIASTAAFQSAADVQVLDAHLYSLYTAPPVNGALRLWEAGFAPAGVVAADLRRSDTDVQPRFSLDYDGKMWWGDGTNPPDANLYRYAANGLAMDYALKLANFSTLLFGNAGDVNLYRQAVDLLQTDDNFTAIGDINAANLTGTYTTFVPTWTGGGAFAIGNGTRQGATWECGNMGLVAMKFVYGSSTNQGTGGWTFGGFPTGVPGPFTDTRATGWWWYIRAASTVRAAGPPLLIGGASTVQCQVGGATPTPAAITLMGGGSVPGAWTTGDIVMIAWPYPIL